MHSASFVIALLGLAVGNPCVASDGALDPGFGDAGRVMIVPPDASLRVYAAATQADGKLLLAGLRWYVGSEPFDNEVAVWRLLANGTLDPNFGQGGLSIVGFGPEFAVAWDLKLDTQGRILLAAQPGFSVLRLLPDGTLDRSFGNAGRASVDFSDLGCASALTFALAIDGSGRVVATGSASCDSVSSAAVVRFSANGVADSAFGDGGRVVLPQGAAGSHRIASLLGVVIDTDGIVATGALQDGTYRFLAMRLLDDGQPDPGFGSSGIATFPASGKGNSRARRVLVDHGRLLLVGGCDVDTDSGSLCALRLFSDGSIDTTYGNAGWATITPASSVRGLVSGVLQSDGKLVLAGTAPLASPTDFAIGRLTVDGTPDPTFGTGGVVTVSFDSAYSNDDAYTVALQGGRIVVAGDTDGVPYIRALAAARLENDLIFSNGLE